MAASVFTVTLVADRLALPETVKVFARVAVLLDSAVGVLQVDRLGRAEGGKTYATQSESAATRFARGQA